MMFCLGKKNTYEYEPIYSSEYMNNAMCSCTARLHGTIIIILEVSTVFTQYRCATVCRAF